MRECECCVHARAVVTWRDHEQEWSPGRTEESAWPAGRTLGRWVHWADGSRRKLGAPPWLLLGKCKLGSVARSKGRAVTKQLPHSRHITGGIIMSYHCGQRRAWCGVQTPEGRRLLRQRLLHRRRRRHRGLLGLTSAYLCAARPTRALLHPHCTTSLHPSRHPLGRWVHWADGLARRVVRGSDRLQPLRLPSVLGRTSNTGRSKFAHRLWVWLGVN